MSEGRFVPSIHRPKPLTRKQLREREEAFKKAKEQIERAKLLSETEQKLQNLDDPEWV